MKGLATLALLLPLAAATPVVIRTTSAADHKPIPDSYIVAFKGHVEAAAASAHHSWVRELHEQSNAAAAAPGGRLELRKRAQLPIVDAVFQGLKHTYEVPGFLGYSGHFDESVVEQIRNHPDVEFVEQDSEVHALESETEARAPWGLARISHRKQLSFATYNKYLYSSDGGEGVDAYVIDTGIYVEHDDFEGRATWGKTIPAAATDADGNGHGTHCAGTIAGRKYGVAKKASLYAVKVLGDNGSGTMADVVKGVEWAATRHVQKAADAKKGKGDRKFKGSVSNMSLGGGQSDALDRMVNAAVDTGMHFAVAAGNDNADSCSSSPARAGKAITVGASTMSDERAYFSNYGTCNDIFAPGLNIESTWIGSPRATNRISGTSMASPHTAGLVAYLLSLQPDGDSAFAVAAVTPAELKKNIMSIATPDALTDVPSDTKNLLAWNGGGSANWTEILGSGNSSAAAHKAVKVPTKMERVEALIDEEIDELKDDFAELEKEFRDDFAELKQEFDELVRAAM